MTSRDLPSISGKDLIKLFTKDGWEDARKANHGRALKKKFGDRWKVTVIPDKSDSMPKGTLHEILGPKQTGIGRDGLLELIDKYDI
ncbi:hypothetical protein SDC9_42723 [bioreactor metagenome]|uniref:Uncharacterized protein n=1 Tax=bioreactor metagenome TaxID=1076179 RepID=A0A644VYN8_9ZZZZ|nr:type II toxin-antitoxin system HicA family toxin [Dehalococcoides mccartyi]